MSKREQNTAYPDRLVQLNVEGNRWKRRVLNLLQSSTPQIACVQEFPEFLMQDFERETGMAGRFFAMANLPRGHSHPRLLVKKSGEIGIAIFSRNPIIDWAAHIYSDIQKVEDCDGLHLHSVGRRGLLLATIQ